MALFVDIGLSDEFLSLDDDDLPLEIHMSEYFRDFHCPSAH